MKKWFASAAIAVVTIVGVPNVARADNPGNGWQFYSESQETFGGCPSGSRYKYVFHHYTNGNWDGGYQSFSGGCAPVGQNWW
jgi:hypothetical protein